MEVPKSKMTPARVAADALLNAALIRPDQLDAVSAIIAANMPKSSVGSYNFSTDVEFLHTCLNHHVDTYFAQVLEPLVMAYHSVQKNGRLIADADIDKAAIELTSEVMSEIGVEYRQYMSKYFGNDVGITSYIYTRIHDQLIATARKYNDKYLELLNSKLNTKKRTTLMETEINASK